MASERMSLDPTPAPAEYTPDESLYSRQLYVSVLTASLEREGGREGERVELMTERKEEVGGASGRC